ncbi:MAG: AcrB/AcrD/AcrF family protein, partial [Terracidiphilus sp.]
MFLPETYQSALALMLLSMLCWGSWANTLKLCPRYRFQLFYWDYAIGLALAALVLGLTAGSMGHSGPTLLADLPATAPILIVYALIGGAVFNVANLLLVAAIDVAGLAVAFPVGIGLALVIGAVSNYVIKPEGNPLLLFGGVALVAVAIVLDAMAYRKREATAKATTARGIIISLAAGVLMGCFYPFVAKSLNGVPGAPSPGPYAVSVFFAIGLLISNVPANWLLMLKPLDGKPRVDGADYFRAPFGWHLAGILGGAIWCLGGVANFVASGAHLVGPAVSYTIGQGATMVSACWGVFVWREFAGAPRSA